jgi:hypothetical protein
MARKVKASLVEVDSVVYAVLCPGKGFLKMLSGSFVFHDQLPRASGCYTTYEAADARRVQALESTYADWQNCIKNNNPCSRIEWKRDRYDAALKAQVVMIEWN